MKFQKIIFILAVFLCFSCSDEDFDDQLVAVDTEALIAEDSDLFELMERMTSDDPEELKVVCIKFIYNFTVVTYDEDSQLQFSQIVRSDEEFSEILGAVPEGTYIGISFPITSQLEDGTTFEINDKDELKAAIDACIEEEQEEAIGNCEGLLLECVWEVKLPEDSGFDTYENAVFDVANDGTVEFYHRGIRYTGTWIVYFIEYELHININLDDPNDVGQSWNFDWKTVILSDIEMDIQTDGGAHYLLKQECEEENYCTTLVFTECELENDPGIAQFTLENYIECIEIIAAPEPEDNAQEGQNNAEYNYSFYFTEQDAINAVNVISTAEPFVNTINPTLLFVRIEDQETGAFIIAEIELLAQECTA